MEENSESEVTPLLRTREVARALAISPRTVIRLVESGELPGFRIGGQVRVPRDELAIYLENNRGGQHALEQVQ